MTRQLKHSSPSWFRILVESNTLKIKSLNFALYKVQINPGPAETWYAFANGVDPDQKLSDLDLHCLSLSM